MASPKVTGISRRLTPFLLLLAWACSESTPPELETLDPGIAGLTPAEMLATLAAAGEVADELVSYLGTHLAVQSAAGVTDALSLEGGTLMDHRGATLVYDVQSGRYQVDASREDAPPDAVRFVLYVLENDAILLPLDESGYLDMAPSGAGVEVRATVGAASYRYVGRGSLRSPPMMGHTIEVHGVATSGGAELRYEILDTLWILPAGAWTGDHAVGYRLTMDGVGSLSIEGNEPAVLDQATSANIRIGVPPTASTSDSSIVDIRWRSEGCRPPFEAHLTVNDQSLRANLDIGGEHWYATTIDSLASQEFDEFMRFAGRWCYETLAGANDAVSDLLSPLMFALEPSELEVEVAAPPLDR